MSVASRILATALALAVHGTAGAQGPGVPMTPSPPGVPMAPVAVPGASSGNLGTPVQGPRTMIAPDGTTTVSGVEIPQEALNRLNRVMSGRPFGSTSPLGQSADTRANDLAPVSASGAQGDKLSSPAPAMPSIDQSTWYPTVQIPGLTSLTPGSGVDGTSNLLTMPAGVAPPGIPQPGVPAR